MLVCGQAVFLVPPPPPSLQFFSSFWICSTWRQKSNSPHRIFRLLTRPPATQVSFISLHQEPITRSEQRSLFGWDIVFTDRVIFSFEFPAKNICFLSGKFKVQLAVDPIKLSESVMGSHSSELSTLSYSLSQDKSLSNSSLLSAMFIKVGKSR